MPRAGSRPSEPVPHLATARRGGLGGARTSASTTSAASGTVDPRSSGRSGWCSRAASGTSSALRRRPDPHVSRVARGPTRSVLEERVERPDGFDLAAYWAESSAAFERDSPRIDVVVRMPKTRLERLGGRRRLARRSRRAERPRRAGTRGWLRLRLDLSWPDEVPGRILAGGLERRGARAVRDPRAGHRDGPSHRRALRARRDARGRVPPHGRRRDPCPSAETGRCVRDRQLNRLRGRRRSRRNRRVRSVSAISRSRSRCMIRASSKCCIALAPRLVRSVPTASSCAYHLSDTCQNLSCNSAAWEDGPWLKAR